MEEERQGLWHFSETNMKNSTVMSGKNKTGSKMQSSGGTGTQVLQSTLIEQEKKTIEKMKNKQVRILIKTKKDKK